MTLTSTLTILAITGYGCSPKAMEIGATEEAVTDPCAPPVHAIACENSNAGTPWTDQIAQYTDSSAILGFATDISVNRGGTIHFKIDIPDAVSAVYHLDIYRLGYYQGIGSRRVAKDVQPTAPPQDQPGCAVRQDAGPEDHLVDCGNWAESASWHVPSTAISGVYLAKLILDDPAHSGKSSHILFVVRDDTGGSDMLFQTSDTTWQAYNAYGGAFNATKGYALYGGYAPHDVTRVPRVSYNRPIIDLGVDGFRGDGVYGSMASYFFTAEYPMVRWLEANGYDVSYAAGVDTDRAGSRLLTHKAFLSVGHDEYWTANQRANIENARSLGVNLAFFSGNEMTWKSHLDPGMDDSGALTPNRTLVCYKETTAVNAPATRGNYSIDNDGLIQPGARNPAAYTITAAGGTPIVITTSVPHLLSTGQPVIITGVTGNTNANRSWQVTYVSPTQFRLNGSASNAAYTGGGTASPPWTGQWSDPAASNAGYNAPSDGGRPQNAVTGTRWVVELDWRALEIPASSRQLRLWRGTDVSGPIGKVCRCAAPANAGVADVPCGCVVGHEWDEDSDNGFRPPGTIRASSTEAPRGDFFYMLDYGDHYDNKHAATHHATMYRNPPTAAGALVFSAGTINWSWGLDGCHDYYDNSFVGVSPILDDDGGACSAGDDESIQTDHAMQQATVNLFADMCDAMGHCIQPWSLRSALAPATRSTDATAPSSMIVAPPSPTIGSPVSVTISASDVGGVVGGVEVSVDGGSTWHPADSRLSGQCPPNQTCPSWSYTWMPTMLGATTLKSRAVDDTGNLETPGPGVVVTVGARPSELLYFYNRTSGQVAYGTMTSGGTYVNAGTTSIFPGWTHIVSVTGDPMAPVGGASPGYNNVLLYYNANAGDGILSWTGQIDDAGAYSEAAPNPVKYSPGPGWTHIVAGSNNTVLFYDQVRGRMMLARLDRQNFFSPLSAGPAPTGYTSVVAGVNNVFLFYNAATGQAETTRLLGPSNTYVKVRAITGLAAGWTTIVAGVNNVLLFFKANPGNAMSARLDDAGTLTILHDPLWNEDLAWTSITAGFKNKTILFYYSPTGQIATGTLDQSGAYVHLANGSGLSTGWTQVVGP